MNPMRAPFELAGEQIPAGTRRIITIPVSVMSDHTPVGLNVQVLHGRDDGPTLFVSAAIHGDEIIGVEIVRRLLASAKLNRLRGTLLAIPIVNTYGFINHSRYLPDRRDLNRSFPGSGTGSLASRLAHIFLNQIVRNADVGIDLHSAAIHRTNLPQIRIAPDSPRLLALAEAFGAPVVLVSPLRQGSLRDAARRHDVDMLLFEAGEGLRFDEAAIRSGLGGTLRVMAHLGMIPASGIAAPPARPIHSQASYWVRASAGGLLRSHRTIGEMVTPETLLGVIADPFGAIAGPVKATWPGLIIGRANLPLVNEGDGLFHIARLAESGSRPRPAMPEPDLSNRRRSAVRRRRHHLIAEPRFNPSTEAAMSQRILLINPNTSTWVTDALVAQIDLVLGETSDIELTAATATLGASYIACEVSYALAAHALLDSFAAHYDRHDAVIVGCFGDPGTAALAQISPVPVIGMAEAAMHEASAAGPFAIVTGGAAWQPILQRLAAAAGFGELLVHIETVARSAGELVRDRPAALALLAAAYCEGEVARQRSCHSWRRGIRRLWRRAGADHPPPRDRQRFGSGARRGKSSAAAGSRCEPRFVAAGRRWSGRLFGPFRTTRQTAQRSAVERDPAQ